LLEIGPLFPDFYNYQQQGEMNVESIRIVSEILASIATIVGIPLAVFIYFQEKRKERQDRESAIFDSLDQWYSDFLKLSFENKDLAAIYYAPFIVGKEIDKRLTDDQKIRQVLYFEMLTSILERAFLIYRNQKDQIKLKRWKGWNDYMVDWMRVKQYREVWDFIGSQWDDDFMNHMNMIRSEVEKDLSVSSAEIMGNATKADNDYKGV
jgi:hypothetical protein